MIDNRHNSQTKTKQTCKESGGLLKTKQSTYDALQAMVGSLNDRYTEFLPPSQVWTGEDAVRSVKYLKNIWYSSDKLR